MTRLAEIQARLGSMGELQDIVGAMRSLAGMRLQEAQRMLPGIRRYAEVIAAAIADTLLLLPEPERSGSRGHGGRAVVLCMSEHGFVGGFNERLADATGRLSERGDALYVLGSRGAALLLERNRKAGWAAAMATRSAAAPETIQLLSTELYREIARGSIDRVEAVYCSYAPGEASPIRQRLILPFDARSLPPSQPESQAPLHNLPPVTLQARLVAEYIFALLTEAAVESIASENAARLSAMESAHDNVSRKLNGLREDSRQARQSEITTEILELVTAQEALRHGSAGAAAA